MANEPQQLGFDLTTRIDTGDSFVKAQQDLANLNQEALDLAKSLSRVENVMDDMKSGTISASKTLQTLEDGYKELSVVVSEFAKKDNLTDEQQQLFKSLQKKMASVKKDIESTQAYITKLRKSGLSEEVALGKLSTNEHKRQNDEKLKQEKLLAQEVSKLRKQQLQETITQTNQAINGFKTIGNEINNAFSSKKSIGNSIFNSMLSYGVLNKITSELNNLGQAIIDINYNTINNQRLMGDYSYELRDNLNSAAAEIASNTGILITDAQQIQGAWIRINDEYAKSSELLNKISSLTAKFMNVGEIENAEEAVALLNASLLQFNVTADASIEKATEFANKWAYMADITAMGTADEYGEAISKFGANVSALNGDMDDAIALSSTLADRLAKDGKEVGTALKTFTTYMNREKTVTLFADIATDLNDTSYNLVDVNGQMLDFDTNIRKIAQAYEHYKSIGDDVMAMDILNAVGATRQRDTAMAIMNSVNSGDYDEYLKKLADPDVNGYIEEQNDALMQSLKNQYNALVVSLQEAGSKIANAGMVDGLTMLMNGVQHLLEVVDLIPTPVLTAAEAFLAFKTAISGLNKIGEITGLTNELWMSLRAGTSVQRDEAAATQSVVSALLDREKVSLSSMKTALGQTDAYKSQYDALKALAEGSEDAAIAYRNGSIDAVEYKNRLDELKSVYASNVDQIGEDIRAKQQLSLTDKEQNALKQEEIALNKISTSTSKNMVAVEKTADNVKKGSLVSLVKEKALISANNGLKKLYIKSTVQSSAAQTKENVARTTSNLLTKIGVTSERAFTTAKYAGAIASGVATAGITALGLAMNLLPIVAIVTGFQLLSYIMGSSARESEKLQENIDDTNKVITETNSRLEELENTRQQRGLTKGEAEELQYLKEYNEELEKTLKLQEQEQNNDKFLNHQGGFLGFGGEDSEKEKLDDLIKSYDKATNDVREYQKAIDNAKKSGRDYSRSQKNLAEANKEVSSSATQIISEYHALNQAIENGNYSDEALESAKFYLETLERLKPTAEQQIGIQQNLGDEIETTADKTEALSEELEGLGTSLNDLTDLFDEYNKEGYLSYETISELIAKHPDYIKYLVKEGNQYKLNKLAEQDLAQSKQDLIDITDELIAQQQKEVENQVHISDSLKEAISGIDNYTQGIANTFKDVKGVSDFTKQLRDINVSLLEGNSSLIDYHFAMDELIKGTDFSKIHGDLDAMDEKTRAMAESQQAMFATLSNQVANYLQEATDALYNQEMSVSDYIETLQYSNQQLLDLYVINNELSLNSSLQWVNASGEVDNYANSLQNSIQALMGVSEAAQFLTDNYAILSQMSSATSEQLANDAWWTQGENANAYNAMLIDFSSVMEQLHTTNFEVWDAVAKEVADAVGKNQNDVFTSTGAITENSQISAAAVNGGVTAMMAMVGDAAGEATSAAGDVFKALGDVVKNFNYSISFAIEGGIKPGGDVTDLLMGKKFNPTSDLKLTMKGSDNSGTIDVLGNALSNFGSSLNNLALKNYLSAINSYKPVNGGGNLSGASGIGNKYNPSDRNTTANRKPTNNKGSGSSKADKEAKEAQKAAEKAAKASKEAAEAIERLTESYVKNVESLQKRIADALKKKYQEQYDERKKLLEKEHNERVEQIQKEIDALNGERPQDKQSELEGLKKKLEQWKNDDSTLGKQKQKEYLDKIAELQKEIKLDELEGKLDKENETYENSIDKDSEFYDKILAKLDKQMSDEMIYREANDLIRNGKIDEITKLLTKYDAQWDGWASLMGKTAGEIIADEVKLAIANYLDVIQGTIKPDGGYHTNKITGGSSSSSGGSKPSSGGSSKPSGGSSSGTISKGRKVKIKDTSAGMYVSYDSGRAVDNWKGWNGTYYVVNTKGSRVALGRTSSIASAIGWIDKKKVVGLNTGGYTGNNQGLAMLHKKERVLNADQTAAFENLIYDFLPSLDDKLLTGTSGNVDNSTNVTFNKELVQVNINKVVQNKEFDQQNGIDNLDRMLRNSLKKSGINLKR